MGRLVNIVCILSMFLSACGLKLPSHVNLPTQLTGGDPQTLEAATAAAQERVNRFRSGDYAGAWLLSSRQMHDAINQTDYVTFEQTCASALSRLPATVTGVRMDGDDRAIVREEVMGFKKSFTMVYEDGKWLEAPDDFWIQNAGKSAQQLIAEQRAAGECGNNLTSTTTATTSRSPTLTTTTTQLPANGPVVVPGTRYAFPAVYASYQPAQERPSVLRFGYRMHGLINLNWSSWGPDGAQGAGDETIQTSCTPDCAGGPWISNPVRIRASNPQLPSQDTLCPADVLYYTDVVIAYPTTVPPHDPSWRGGDGGAVEWTTDSGLTAAHYSDWKPDCSG